MPTKHRAILAVEAEAKTRGNGAHIMVPKEWLGRRFLVVEMPDPADGRRP